MSMQGKPTMRGLSKWIVLLIDVALFSLAACTAPTPAPTRGPASEGFAIYLPAQKIAAHEMLEADLSDLALEDRPVLSVDDIVTYSKSTHEIELTPAAYARLSQLSVPIAGMPFVACVDRAPVYGGAFWVAYSSVSFNGIVIDTLPATQHRPIRIQLGYPEAPELFVGEDRRSDPRIIQSLEQAGKLR